ncbi:hypothetical protein ACOMHN_004654 [Nucella lapillus]
MAPREILLEVSGYGTTAFIFHKRGSYCPRTWDTLMCWPDTPAGVTVFKQCPGYIHGFDQSQQASRQCMENGTWFKSDLTGRSWTNYSLCIMNTVTTKSVHPLIVQHMQGIKLMSTIGYTLSLAVLILAVSIMVCFRRLHCARNLIHLNMFVAFLIRAAFSLLKTVLLVKDLGFPMDVKVTGQGVEFIQEGSHWACKLFFTLFHYVIFASLVGLFNEGLYLVLILSLSVFVDRIKIRCFVLLGWGVPVIFIVPWVVCRMVFDDILCWNVHVRRDILWILRAPMMASVAVDFAFFIHIVRLLFTKLTAFNCPESRRVRYRKLAKSTLILIPLFAVYYIGFMWLPDHLSAGSDLFKLYAEMLFDSFQGFLVALLFCFLNAEVQNEIRKKWREHVVDRNGSWRSRHSLCSFLPRSVSTPKAKGQGHAPSNPQHPSNPDARSSVLPPVVVVAAITVDKNRVTVTPICMSSMSCQLNRLPCPISQSHRLV